MMLLPLFPLNLVLFPGLPIRLHIFEDRYKRMISHCLETQSPFGIILIDEGAEAHGPLASPHLVGTTAQITEVQHLPNGRMNIVARGIDRFRVLSLDYQSQPYLVGQVEILSMQDESITTNTAHVLKLRKLIRSYLTAIGSDESTERSFEQMPIDALLMAYLGASIVQSSNDAKQELLEINDIRTLISELADLYRSEITLLSILASAPPVDDRSDLPFSVN
jgi:uncharacterized protein